MSNDSRTQISQLRRKYRERIDALKTDEEIAEAYRKTATSYHPDKRWILWALGERKKEIHLWDDLPPGMTPVEWFCEELRRFNEDPHGEAERMTADVGTKRKKNAKL